MRFRVTDGKLVEESDQFAAVTDGPRRQARTPARPQHQIVVDRILGEPGEGSLGRHSWKGVISVLCTVEGRDTRHASMIMPLDIGLRHCGIKTSDRARIKPYDRTAYDLVAASGALSIDSGGTAALDGPKPIRTLMSPPFDCPAAP